jgi:putative copper resistance protein D
VTFADAVVLGLRALAFVAVFQAVGAAIFLWLFARELDASAEAIRMLAKTAALVAVVLTALHHVLLPARLAGTFAATLDPSLSDLVLQSNIGPAHAIRLAGLALLAVSLDQPTRLHVIASLIGAGLALLSFALMGHTTIHALRFVLAPLLLVHIASAAFWFGSLWPLRMIAEREPIELAGRVIARFSALAVRSVPLIFVCGAAMTLIFVRSIDALVSGYGAMVALKTLAYAALLSLAAFNRQRLVQQIVAANGAALRLFTGVVRAEWLIIAGVLIATALMTDLFSPEGLHASFSAEHAEAQPDRD